jgi:4-hydroxy-4-methyl-2-oxoglutarate aldolase
MQPQETVMIDDAPLITLRRPTRRPSPAQLAALASVPTGFVVDALGGTGALDAAIKPVVPHQATFCGVALPCHAGPADNLAVFAALQVLQPGDVVVAATDGFRRTSVTGDLLLGMARNLGAVAFVTDGCVRDVPGIESVGLPCFAAGVTPNSPSRNGPGMVGLPVSLGFVPVEQGDIVIGDGDGVVVVPHGAIARVIDRLEAVKRAEADLDAKVKAGLGLPDFVSRTLEGRVRIVE